MQSEQVRELEEIDRRLKYFVDQLSQARLERRMASMGFDSAPIKCDTSYVESLCIQTIVEARRVRAKLVDRIASSDNVQPNRTVKDSVDPIS